MTSGRIVLLSFFLFLFAEECLAVPSKKELEEMERQMKAQNMEHKKLQAQAMQINIELSSISQETVTVAKQIQNNEETLSTMEAELESLKTELLTAENDFSIEDDNLIRMLAALQNLALKPTEALFVQPLTPVEIIRSAMLLRETVPYLEENAQRLREKLEEIDQKKNKVERQVNKIVAQKKSLQSKHDQMTALVRRKSKIRNDVEMQSVKTKRNADELASQAKDLRELLAKLEVERIERTKKREAERRKRLTEEEASLQEQKQVEERATDLIKYDTDNNMSEIGESFVKAKGKLIMPARGPIITSYGEETAKGVSSKGISIKTRNQAQVVSPYDGQVIFSGPFRGYGNMIIVEHGQGYLSLMAGMESIDIEMGQMLLAGEPIGQMSNSAGSRLYVEIRKDNQPINPMAWIERN